MSIAAEKVAEVLALPEQDRAFLARQLRLRGSNLYLVRFFGL